MSSSATLLLVAGLCACKGCKKDGETENPSIDELVIEVCDNGEDDNGDGLVDCAEPRCQPLDACVFEPPNPADIAPPIDPTNLIGFADRVRFLWEGDNPVIRGVDPDALDEAVVSVVRVHAVDRSGNPISGIQASIAGQQALGYTFSRADGAVDLVANGGSPVTVRLRAPGFLTVDRTLGPPARDYTPLEDVVLTPVSDKVTTLDDGGLASGEPFEDDDGERTPRIWFPAGTTATVLLPDGQRGDTTTFDVRLTEYTVGEAGPAAMPALLPSDSAYTYAAELTVDQAEDLGATDVSFDKTGWLYLDNFLDFEVGQPVPSGFYSRTRRRWEAEENGQVLMRVGDGVDVDGDERADDGGALEAIGLSGPELETIRDVIADGESFWRVPVTHFSPYDLNWPYNLPDGAASPDELGIDPPNEKDPCAEAGSLIECQNQVLTKRLPLPGTDHELVYRSDRTEGRLRSFELNLTGDEVPDILKRILVMVRIEGQLIEEEFEALEPNLTYEFDWDGLDVFGREVRGPTNITVRVAHVYEAQFAEPDADLAFGNGGGADQRPARVDVPLWRTYRGPFGSFDAAAAHNLGGWALGIQHAYDGGKQTFYPASRPEIRRGDLSRTITNFETFLKPTGLPLEPRDASYSKIGVYPATDGGLFIFFAPINFDGTIVVRRHPDGRLEHWAGQAAAPEDAPAACLVDDNCGEGGPATEAYLRGLRWAVGPDDSLYFSSFACVRRVADGIVEKIAGDCLDVEEPDGQPDFPNNSWLAIGPNSEIYVAGGGRVVRAYPGTRRIDFLAGCAGFCDDPIVAGGPALGIELSPEAVVATPDGGVYFFDAIADAIVRVDNGRLDVVHRRERGVLRGTAAGPDGAIYWSESVGGPSLKLRRLKDGNVATLGGVDDLDPADLEGFGAALDADGIPATEAVLTPLGAPAVLQERSIYFGTSWDVDDAQDDTLEPVIKRIGEAFPDTLGGDDALIAAPNGRILYRFAAAGQLQDIRSTINGLVLQELTYGDDGLDAVTDRYGRVLSIERDGRGAPTGIVGPYGHRTAITTNADGYATEFEFPDGTTVSADYTADGLLVGWRDHAGAVSSYTYDPIGYLTRAEDSEGGWKTLTRTRAGVMMESSTGRTFDYSVDPDSNGATTLIIDGDGQTWQTTELRGERELVEPDGTVKTTRLARDPRFGRQSEFVGSRTTTTPSGLQQVSTRTREATPSADRAIGVGSIMEAIEINGAITTYQYDEASHSVTRTSPEGRTRTFGFDEQNRNSRVQVGDLDPVSITYDGDGRISQMRQGDTTVSWTFGSDGLPVQLTGPDGGTVSVQRDPHGRVTQFTAPSGRVFEHEFDARGRLTSVAPPGGEPFTQTFNGYDRLVSFAASTDEDVLQWNADRNLTGVQRANGMARTVQWDAAGRVSGWSSERGEVTREYDAATGQVTSSSTPDGSVGLTYDGFLIAGREVTFEGQTHTIEREHDDDFRLTRRTIDGQAIDLEYDLDGLPTRVGDAELTLHPALPAASELRVGSIETVFTLDSRGRQQRALHTTGATTLLDGALSFDAGNRIARIEETIDGAANVLDYTYDADGQLLTVSRDGTPEAQFTYDDRGNRTTLVGGAVATYDVWDRILTAGPRSYSVDASGFVTGWTDGAETTSLTFDHHELVSVENAQGQFEYGYDSLGRRIWRRVDGAFDRGWLYDDTGRPLAEVDGSGAVVSRFVYTTTHTVPTYLVRDGATYRVLTDHVGSVRLVVDASTGQIVQRLDYDALGSVTQDTNPGFQPFGFAGGLHDPDTGIVRLGQRDYDGFTGRWLSRDPNLFGGRQHNLYAYAHNDPINFVDATGLAAAFALKGAGVFVLLTAPGWVPLVQWSFYEDESNRRAQEIGARLGLDRLDAENAMRHCVGQCAYNKLTRDSGLAKAVGDYHEIDWIPKKLGFIPTFAGGEENAAGGEDYWDRQKDQFNNVCGRDCSRQNSDCLDCCAADFEAGLLATDLPEPTLFSEALDYTPAMSLE